MYIYTYQHIIHVHIYIYIYVYEGTVAWVAPGQLRPFGSTAPPRPESLKPRWRKKFAEALKNK